jgi:hypothetical protein
LPITKANTNKTPAGRRKIRHHESSEAYIMQTIRKNATKIIALDNTPAS